MKIQPTKPVNQYNPLYKHQYQTNFSLKLFYAWFLAKMFQKKKTFLNFRTLQKKQNEILTFGTGHWRDYADSNKKKQSSLASKL